jgi:futalosine hydrolase
MKMTIVAATSLEVAPLLEHYQVHLTKAKDLYSNLDGSLHVLVTGMGMMQTAAHLALYASRNDRDLYIDAGIAGAFNRDIQIGEVTQVISETYGDFGVEDGDEFADFFEMGFIDQHQDAFEYGKISPYGNFFQHPSLEHLIKVHSLTVNKVHGKEETIAMIMKKYTADIENMEGLAFFYVTHQIQKPSIEIRSISNYVEKRNKDNWDIRLAVNNLNEVLFRMLEAFQTN